MTSFECKPLLDFFIEKSPEGLNHKQMEYMAIKAKNKLKDAVNSRWGVQTFSDDNPTGIWRTILGMHIEIYIKRHVLLTDINPLFKKIEGNWQIDLINVNDISDDEVCALIYLYCNKCLEPLNKN